MNDVIQLLNSHSSVRNFTDKAVDDELLKELIQAGQQASTSSYIQAYTIIRVKNTSNKKVLAALSGEQKHIEQCPVFLVFCADLNRLERACSMNNETFKSGYTETFILATVDTALVAQNIMIAAEASGLGGVYAGGIRNNPRDVCNLLKIPYNVYPVFGMCLGYPEKINPAKPRLPLPLILKEDSYTMEEDETGLREYDRIVSEYYQKRTKGTRSTTWTEGVAELLKEKQRPHMRDFLMDQGFTFK